MLRGAVTLGMAWPLVASASVSVAYPWAGRVMGEDAVVGASSTTQAREGYFGKLILRSDLHGF